MQGHLPRSNKEPAKVTKLTKLTALTEVTETAKKPKILKKTFEIHSLQDYICGTVHQDPQSLRLNKTSEITGNGPYQNAQLDAMML